MHCLLNNEMRMRNYTSEVLVQIVKHDWPEKWTSFFPDLVAAARTSENFMAILKLLSQEIFDFSRGEMTPQKIKELKQSLNSEFKLIHELCLHALSAYRRQDLIHSTLSALHPYLSWIPSAYIFEPPLLEYLLRYFRVPESRNIALQCLTKVVALDIGDVYNVHYYNMYTMFAGQLKFIVPQSIELAEAYSSISGEDQAFIKNLALFFTSFFKLRLLILKPVPTLVLMGLQHLLCISYVDDTEVFKICLDYWNSLVSDLSYAQRFRDLNHEILELIESNDNWRSHYSNYMSKLRGLMINRMAKPEEVLVVEDENGNIVRETKKDIDVLVQNKIMQVTLIDLLDLDCADTVEQMLRRLNKHLTGEQSVLSHLNSLCWAIGSISGSITEDQENSFLEIVIRDLLKRCEITEAKNNKALVASNIMYVVGKYPLEDFENSCEEAVRIYA